MDGARRRRAATSCSTVNHATVFGGSEIISASKHAVPPPPPNRVSSVDSTAVHARPRSSSGTLALAVVASMAMPRIPGDQAMLAPVPQVDDEQRLRRRVGAHLLAVLAAKDGIHGSQVQEFGVQQARAGSRGRVALF